MDQGNARLKHLRQRKNELSDLIRGQDIVSIIVLYIRRKFAKLRIVRMKGGIFNGPQIGQFMKDANFVKVMTVPL